MASSKEKRCSQGKSDSLVVFTELNKMHLVINIEPTYLIFWEMFKKGSGFWQSPKGPVTPLPKEATRRLGYANDQHS